VFLDHVDFDKRSWQQRNRIKTPQGELLLTVPVMTKGKGAQPINEVLIQKDNPDFPGKLLKSLEHNYKKAPHYAEYADDIAAILEKGHDRLCDLNVELIEFFRAVFGIATPVSFSSQMDVEGAKADLLANICALQAAGHYVSPPGAKDYIDASDAFGRKGVEVSFFTYEHPSYHQPHGDFLPYMAAVDLLFNEGDKSLEIIRRGVKA
jgi:hypothetical protein